MCMLPLLLFYYFFLRPLLICLLFLFRFIPFHPATVFSFSHSNIIFPLPLYFSFTLFSLTFHKLFFFFLFSFQSDSLLLFHNSFSFIFISSIFSFLILLLFRSLSLSSLYRTSSLLAQSSGAVQYTDLSVKTSKTPSNECPGLWH